jgi:nucleoside-diphosphate-sugar epimerase
VRLVLDEHFSPEIARQLRRRGHDVVAARDLLAGADRSDAELLRRATEAGRTVVTADLSDFIELHRSAVVSGRSHAGIVLASPRRFPPTKRAIGRLVSALDAFLQAHPDERPLDDQTWWLEP